MSNETNWEWLIPIRERGRSGAIRQNFLCRSGAIYVMDNHRAALWCWLQEIDPLAKHSLIHIDRHSDTLQSRLSEWLNHLPPWDAGIDEYLAAGRETSTGWWPTVTWDNYLSIYLDQFGHSIDMLRFLTHGDGDKPNFTGVLFGAIWELPSEIEGWINYGSTPWIVNIDLDYFYCETEEGPQLMVSDAYLSSTFAGLKRAMDAGRVSVVTICLTPDCYTAGWASVEALATQVLGYLGMDFVLPQTDPEGCV